MTKNISQAKIYSFSFKYELLGNRSDFDYVLQVVARDFMLVHWIDEEKSIKIQPNMNCIIRKQKNSWRYQLIKPHVRAREEQLAMTSCPKEKEKMLKADSQIAEVIGQLNEYFQKQTSQNNRIEFLTLQQLTIHLPSEDKKIVPATDDKQQSEIKTKQKQKGKDKTKKVYEIPLQRSFQNRYQKIGTQIKLTNVVIDPKTHEFYEFAITINSSILDLNQSLREAYQLEYKYNGIRLLVIDFKVEDRQRFFQNVVKTSLNPFKKEIYQYHDQFFPVGKIKIPFIEDRAKRNKVIKQKHYSLAFQGGGAKGLAYVGAYRALKQNYISLSDTNEQKIPIPITSIMGSSAGGMISLAVSTGISHRQLQKICFKMKDIPKNDSFRQAEKPKTNQLVEQNQDAPKKEALKQSGTSQTHQRGHLNYSLIKDDQQPKTKQEVFQSIKMVLKQYGILQEQLFDYLKQSISQNVSKVAKNLLTWLSANFPSLGDIFRNENGTINLEGLLIKGALMKGDGVHAIGVECLIKYFLKLYYQNKHEELQQLLRDCFQVYRDEKINDPNFNNDNISDEIMTCLKNYHQIGKKILDMPISQIQENYTNSSEILISIINTLIVTIVDNEECCRPKAKEDYLLKKRIDNEQDQLKKFVLQVQWNTLKKVMEFKQYVIQQRKKINDMQNSDIEQKIRKGSAALWDILNITQSKFKYKHDVYEQLKLSKGETNLLNPTFFRKSTQKCDITLREFIAQLLGDDYKQYFSDIKKFCHAQTKFQLQGWKLPKFELQIAQFVSQCFQITTPKQKWPQLIQQFKQNKQKFSDAVCNITMIQYYMLTNVELTCTSVDLDDKILRLFNKKTTPFLPVCKAVQMSGSFPGAFKAQKWDKRWGVYSIFYHAYRADIRLTDHQFTDGGLLANFPIRYLDNKELRTKYMSHSGDDSNTIMLGFGLDYISNNYQPNMKQIYQLWREQKKKKEASEQLTIDNLMSSIGMFNFAKIISKFGFKIFASYNSKQETIDWTDINHAVINKVPLIRFLLKLLDAYPNSDRNFNFQTFANRVLHQNIYQKWKNKYEVFERELREIDLASVKVKNVLAKMKSLKYPLQDQNKKKKVITLETYEDPNPLFQKTILQKCRKREQQLNGRVQLKKMFLQNFLKAQQEQLLDHDPWFKKHSSKLNRQMTKKLILILRMLLGQTPNEVRRALSLEYIQLKYPKTWTRVHNPLEYDVSQSYKRMVQFMYLRLNALNSLHKEQMAENISRRSYEQLLQDLDNHEDQKPNGCQSKFTYKNIKKEFNKILNKVLEILEHSKDIKDKGFIPWNEDFVKYIKHIIDEKNVSQAQLYCLQTFRSNFYVKNEDVDQKQFEQFSLKTQKELQAQLYLRFKENMDHFQPDNNYNLFKNNYVFEAENIYSKNKAALDQILLKQLSRRPMEYITKIQQSKVPEIRSVVDNNSKYLFIKLIRALTYEREPQDGGQSFQIRQRKQIENAILTLFFGTNRKRYQKFKQYLKDLDERTKSQFSELKQFTKSLIKNQQNDQNHQILQSYFLRLLEMQVLSFVIANKIVILNRENSSNITEDAQQMFKKYSHFSNDFRFIISCLKEIVVILSVMSKHPKLSLLDIRNPENFQKPTFKYQDKLRICQKTLYHIIEQFVTCSHELSVKPNNTIKMTHLEETFMIRFDLIKSIIKDIYYPLKYRHLELTQIEKSKDEQQLRYVNYILSILDKLTYNKFSIPLFEIDWKLTLKSLKVLTVCEQQVKTRLSYFAQQIKFIVLHQMNGTFMSQKIHQNEKSKFHLILQGVSSSNQYYCTIISLAKDIYMSEFLSHSVQKVPHIQSTGTKTLKRRESIKSQQSLLHKNDRNMNIIEAVTSSNFHCMFGFLLATNVSLDQVKKQMYHLRRISQQYQNSQKIEGYFQSYQWLNECTNQYKQLLKYLENERSEFFQSFELLKQKNYSLDSLKSQYEYIKSQFKNETRSFVQSYDRILQLVTQQVQVVDGYYRPVIKPRQICKRFAFDYIEDFEQKIRYKYSRVNSQVFEKLKSVVSIVYETFGSLIQGVFCTIVARYGAITITESNAKYITKGIIIKRLLTSFQLKEYIAKKLKQLHLSPSITLSKFYDSAPRPVFLNFCAINMNEERLQFLNKTTMPFMPLWAAILASTALPFLYNYFPARQEWQGVEQKSTFYSLIVEKFFETNVKTKQTTQYCSSNYISSLPLQIITNKAVLQKIGIFEEKQKSKGLSQLNDNDSKSNHSFKPTSLRDLKQLAMAFNDRYQDGFRSLKVTKKYFNYSRVRRLLGSNLLYTIKKSINLGKIINWCKKKKQKQDGTSYWGKYMSSISKIGYVGNVMSTLINSNDNFVLQWYRDKLIKLPIKLGTLDFHLILDKECLQKHRVKMLSQKAKQTVQRSYEITKSFANYITQDEEQKQSSRYKVQMRFEMIYFKNEYQQVTKLAKLTMMNHSKWNQNRFNNFNAYFRVSNQHAFAQQFSKATQSQMVWNVQKGTGILMNFYFPHFPQYAIKKPFQLETDTTLKQKNEDQQKNNKHQILPQTYDMARVYYTRWKIDFREIFDHMYNDKYTVTDADTIQFQFDYFNLPPQYERNEKDGQKVGKLKPKVKNNIFYFQYQSPKIKVINISYNDQQKKRQRQKLKKMNNNKTFNTNYRDNDLMRKISSQEQVKKRNRTHRQQSPQSYNPQIEKPNKQQKLESIYISQYPYF